MATIKTNNVGRRYVDHDELIRNRMDKMMDSNCESTGDPAQDAELESRRQKQVGIDPASRFQMKYCPAYGHRLDEAVDCAYCHHVAMDSRTLEQALAHAARLQTNREYILREAAAPSVRGHHYDAMVTRAEIMALADEILRLRTEIDGLKSGKDNKDIVLTAER